MPETILSKKNYTENLCKGDAYVRVSPLYKKCFIFPTVWAPHI